MAVDTRDKRGGAIQEGLGLEVLPLADGSVGQADRQQAAQTYPGILATDLLIPEVDAPTVFWAHLEPGGTVGNIEPELATATLEPNTETAEVI